MGIRGFLLISPAILAMLVSIVILIRSRRCSRTTKKVAIFAVAAYALIWMLEFALSYLISWTGRERDIEVQLDLYIALGTVSNFGRSCCLVLLSIAVVLDRKRPIAVDDQESDYRETQ